MSDKINSNPSTNNKNSRRKTRINKNVDISITKSLTKLLSIPSNRCCADCKVTLVDAAQVYASFSPVCPRATPQDFLTNHEQFAPPGVTTTLSPQHIQEQQQHDVDPALLAARRIGRHGVMVCAPCASAHNLLGASIAVVRAVQDDQWSQQEVDLMSSRGNQLATRVLEAYLPAAWEKRRPVADSTIAERLMFCRAKYEALAFCLPRSGPLADQAWRRLVQRWYPQYEGALQQVARLEVRASTKRNLSSDISSLMEPPNRLVDHFCVVTASDVLDPMTRTENLSLLNRPEDLLLSPQVVDCFPQQDTHDDTEFPEHISTLVFPDGCHPVASSQPPTFFTFCLTTSLGNRLYGAVLRIYDDVKDTQHLYKIMDQSDYEGERPKWQDGVLYFPKCLVVVSHYPYFDLYRKFLCLMYRIVLTQAPLPIERFIANFVCEVPLPPPGQVQVQLGYAVEKKWVISRPPENQLPLCDFSYRPLFSCLSISNILLVWACLLQESKVVLLSKHRSLLTPVAEALLSLLFPLQWQGVYLPVMPFRMLDLLDAPVPYLVGLHSKYWSSPHPKPEGVIFVLLDTDQVHLGVEDNGSARKLPALPDRPANKLKTKLLECATGYYLAGRHHTPGVMKNGKGRDIPVMARDVCYQMQTTEVVCSSSQNRQQVLNQVDRAYKEDELLEPLHLLEHGQTFGKSDLGVASPVPIREKVLFPRLRMNGRKSVMEDRQISGSSASEGDFFSVHPSDEAYGLEIRHAFLRFFVSLFKDYRSYIDLKLKRFRSKDFATSLGLQPRQFEYVTTLLGTQMFDCFVRERIDLPNDPQVRFFDESIEAKRKRSRRLGRSMSSTDFLDDTSTTITETFAPPSPSNWGLPDDGRMYQYASFPTLNPSLFGKTRPARKWPQSSHIASRHPPLREKERAVLDRAMAPVLKTQELVRKATKHGVQKLESALGALSAPFAIPTGPVTKQQESSRPRLSRSEMHLMRSSGSKAAMEGEGREVLSVAEEVVLNARRKQSILVGIFIQLQSHGRGYIVRNKGSTTSRKQALKVITNGNNNHIEEYKDQTKAAIKIQNWYRGRVRARCYRKMRFLCTSLAAVQRGRKVRFAFDLLQKSVARVQARIRGTLTRQRLDKVLRGRMDVYRFCAFDWWMQTATSLSYRAKFWTYLEGHGLVEHALAEAELERLRVLLPALPFDEMQMALSNDYIWSLGNGLGIRAGHYCVAKRVTVENVGKENEVNLDPSSRESAERLQIYERLSNMKGEKLSKVMARLICPSKEKKTWLSKTIWTNFEFSNESAEVMIELFPELNSSTDIYFAEPSKKSQRRVPSSLPLPGPLDSSMWAHLRKSDLIRRNVAEVAMLGIKGSTVVGKKTTNRRMSFLQRKYECNASELRVQVMRDLLGYQ